MNETDQIHPAQKKGYLNNDLEAFYIHDKALPSFEYHYHDFYKLLIHIQGDVRYLIEGKEYALAPGDTILINPGEIHKPSMHNNTIYERIIAYISDTFFEKLASYDTDLKQCFTLAKTKQSHLVRSNSSQAMLNQITEVMKSTFITTDYGNHLLRRIKIEEYLIIVNRILNFEDNSFIQPTIANEKVLQAIDFINQNIDKDLCIEYIASNLFVHKSYLMHLFKKETGHTIGKYINEKRLFLSNQYIQAGKTMTEACYLAGFQNYGTFYYAYKKKYGNSPRNQEYTKNMEHS
jgi:AraC-like DNA-binding protein/uncharacterized cupin superfamily protein